MRKNKQIMVLTLAAFMLAGCTSGGESSSSSSTTTSEASSVSSSTSEATKYSITVTEVTGATVNVASSSEAGKTVSFTITLTDAENKKVDSVTVKSGDTTINVTNSNGSYSFVMPEGNVTITVTLGDVIHYYALTFNKDENVAGVKASIGGTEITDLTSVREGETVQLDLTFNEKYTLLAISANVSSVQLTTITEGLSYSFVMPHGDLAISITSEKVAQTYSITSVEIVSAYVSKITGVEADQEVLEGTDVSVSVTLSSYSKWYGGCIYVNGEVVELTKDSSDSKLYNGSFTMPAENVKIEASHLYFEESDKTKASKFTFTNSDLYTIYGLKNNGYYITDNSDYNHYFSYEISIKASKGVKISSVSAQAGDDAANIKTFSSSGDGIYSLNWNYWYYVTLPGNEISITVDATYVGVNNVKIDNNSVGKISLTGSTEFIPGDTVKYTVEAINNYIMLGVEKIVVEDGNGTTLDTSYNRNGYYEYSSYYKTLTIYNSPKYDLTIYFSAQKGLPVEIQSNEYIKSVDIESYDTKNYKTVSDTLAVPGTRLSIMPTLTSYSVGIITAVKVNGEEATKYSSSTWHYNIPADTTAEKFVISFEVEQYHTITYDKNATTYKIYSLSPSYNYYKGLDVTVNVHEVAGYKVDKVYLTNGTELTKSTTTEGAYSFTMPNEDVEIKVDTTAVATHAVTVEKDAGIKSVTYKNKYGLSITEDSLATVNEGDKITATITTNNGFSFTSATFGNEALAVKSSDTVEFTVTADGTLSLTTTEAPKSKIAVNLGQYLTISKVQDAYNQVAAQEDGTYYGYIDHKIMIDFTLADDAKSDYKMAESGFTVKDSSGKDVTFTFSGSRLTFTMPEGGVTIEANPVAIPKANYTITGNLADKVVLTQSYGGYTDASKIITSGKVTVGETLYFYLVDDTYSSDYTYSLVVKEGEKVVLSESFDYNHDYYNYKVTSNDLTIEVNKNAK